MKSADRSQFSPGRRAVVATTVLSLGALFAPGILRAQQANKPARIGLLSFGAREPYERRLRQALGDLGYVDGRNIRIEHRWADGKADRLRTLAAELVRSDVALIVASTTPSIQAAMEATRRIPIVMATAGDALRTGLVANLARPEGNATGLSLALIELAGKTVELLRETLPGVTRLACLVHKEDPLHREFLAEAKAACARLGLQFQPAVISGGEELDAAIGAIARARAGGVLVQPIFAVDPEVRSALIRLTLKHRLPAVCGLKRFAESGGLMAYASEFPDLHERAAVYVDRILKGTPPGDLPVQQPTRFELIFNMNTAKKLGLTIPRPLLMRADRVIE